MKTTKPTSNWKYWLLSLMGFGTLGVSLETDVLEWVLTSIASTTQQDTTAIPKQIAPPPDRDSILRISELQQQWKQKAPNPHQLPKRNRIGCICMDNAIQNHKGGGACSGHSGVRFWLYQHQDSILKVPTQRHFDHPAPLPNTPRQPAAALSDASQILNQEPPSSKDFYRMLTILCVCGTFIILFKNNLYHK